jgi:hypothetical protein
MDGSRGRASSTAGSWARDATWRAGRM